MVSSYATHRYPSTDKFEKKSEHITFFLQLHRVISMPCHTFLSRCFFVRAEIVRLWYSSETNRNVYSYHSSSHVPTDLDPIDSIGSRGSRRGTWRIFYCYTPSNTDFLVTKIPPVLSDVTGR